MPTIEKQPRDPWPNAARGLEVRLLPGVHGPVEFSGATDMVIQGTEGAIIEGSLIPGGGEPPTSMRFHDGCHRLAILGPLEVRESEGRGIRITGADDITLADLFIHHNAIEGIITGNCKRGSYRNITVEDSRNSPISAVRLEYTPDKRHGIYISGNADGSVVEDLEVSRVTGSGLQLNGAGMEAVITAVEARRLMLSHCGSGGTPPISLMAVQDSRFEQFNEDWTTGDRWAVCFADGHGASYACRNVTFREYTVPRGTHCAEEEGSSAIHYQPGAGWSPGALPEPEPGPEPEPEPPDNEALAQALDEADTALQEAEKENLAAYEAVTATAAAIGDAQAALARATELAAGAL